MQALGMRGVAVLYLCLCSFASTNFTRSDIFLGNTQWRTLLYIYL